MDDLLYDIALSYDQSMTCIEKRLLIESYGSAKNVLELEINKLKNILGRRWSGKSFNKESLIKKANIAYKYIKKSGTKIYRFFDKEYPASLREIPDHPFLIFVKGDIVGFKKAIAVVGTRSPDKYGIESTIFFVKELVKNDYVIVSGLALGIDTVAHETAIKSSGKTVAVIGCGIDRVYPFINKNLVRSILDTGGAIISEYPPGIPAYRWNFPKRNRIIVALSDAVLITQSPEKSGTIITGNLAFVYNKKLFVIKKDIYTEKDAGNRNFITMGANDISTPDDLIKKI